MSREPPRGPAAPVRLDESVLPVELQVWQVEAQQEVLLPARESLLSEPVAPAPEEPDLSD